MLSERELGEGSEKGYKAKTKAADLSRAQCVLYSVLYSSGLITGLTNMQRLAETNRRVLG